jgi:outer membrane lipoprotein-sorting protein
MNHRFFCYLVLGLLVSGCGEQLTGEAQKAVEQIKAEASTAAAKAIDDIKIDAVTRLKNVQGVPEKKDQPDAKIGKNEDVVIQK